MLVVNLHQQDVMKQLVKLHLVIHLLLEQQMDQEILILLNHQILQIFFGNLFQDFYPKQLLNKFNVNYQNQFYLMLEQ
jgi:hypothetical protein